jgi:hypothetical protein
VRSSGRWIRDRVPPGWAERAAAQQPPHGQPGTASGAVSLHGNHRVLRARWAEPARGGASLEGTLVADDHADQPPRPTARLHTPSMCRSSNVSSVNDSRAAAGCAPNRNNPAGGGDSANNARRRRRRRLRATAGPKARPIANATCGGLIVGSMTKVHQRAPARVRWPSTLRRRKELRSRTRRIKPRAGGGPCRGAPSRRRVRPGCSCAPGTRASSHDDGCSVGTCASRSLLRCARVAELLVTRCSGPRTEANWPISPGYGARPRAPTTTSAPSGSESGPFPRAERPW